MNLLRSSAEHPPRIPDHTLIRCIGSGNYGKVWLARNVMGTFRAIKVIHRDKFQEQRPYDREYSGIMKYEPISRSHPGFVSVLHIGNNSEERYFYYIMEVADDATHGQHFDPQRYVSRTLATDKERFQRLPVAECLRLGLQLASALGHLHRQNLVHRDIKPSNIIFVNDSPKFADIGLVTDIGEGATFVGSEGYMPPEGPGKPAADIYALGKVLFELISGEHQLNYPKLPGL
jgi:serine/threonine protein kinase